VFDVIDPRFTPVVEIVDEPVFIHIEGVPFEILCWHTLNPPFINYLAWLDIFTGW
jgi:hypothetical protein